MTTELLKLNLGSGNTRIPGYTNVDYSEECNPDLVLDLEKIPWSFESNSVSNVIMNHVLEHLGQSPRVFLQIMQELYRICINGALIQITVPHPTHDDFLSDPTHVRSITSTTLALFDREQNLIWRKAGNANSPLALQCNVDFKIIKTVHNLDRQTTDRLNTLKEKDPFLAEALWNHGRNIIKETTYSLQVIK
jgi:hypothetical protein